MEVWVFYGPTGTGKSRAAHEMAPDAFWLRQASSGVGWWCGYNGETDVIIDEFYGWLQWSFLLRLLDRYPLVVETKGSSVNFVGRRIIITSNTSPVQWYARMAYATLARRFHRVIYCGTDTWTVEF